LPKQEWLDYVTTAKAKTKIESFLKKQKIEETKKGEALFYESLRKEEIEPGIQVLDKLVAFYGYSKKEELFHAIFTGQVELPEHLKKILKEKSENFFLRQMKRTFDIVGNLATAGNKEAPAPVFPEIDRKKTYILTEEEFQKNYVVDSCCNPIPGDEVLGYIQDDGRIQVHKRSCPKALKLKTYFGNRIISCEWASNKTFSFPVSIEVKGIDRMGMLKDIVQVITDDLSVNMRKLLIESKDEFFEGQIVVAVHDVNDVNKLVSRLQKIKGLKSVTRIDA
jgi:GTP pyrophosphokinase